MFKLLLTGTAHEPLPPGTLQPVNPKPASATAKTEPVPSLSEDLLRGAEQIATFMFGDPKMRRQVYHLAQTGQIPVFKLGSTLCARRSTLISRIESLETESKR